MRRGAEEVQRGDEDQDAAVANGLWIHQHAAQGPAGGDNAGDERGRGACGARPERPRRAGAAQRAPGEASIKVGRADLRRRRVRTLQVPRGVLRRLSGEGCVGVVLPPRLAGVSRRLDGGGGDRGRPCGAVRRPSVPSGVGRSPRRMGAVPLDRRGHPGKRVYLASFRGPTACCTLRITDCSSCLSAPAAVVLRHPRPMRASKGHHRSRL
mmetsp:Transcript_1586/g.4756  ORF Transcript_1586/g.4756 Transcript_1586/m.4756 type:complete len:210 (-) Transcript_1586:256-885(-)